MLSKDAIKDELTRNSIYVDNSSQHLEENFETEEYVKIVRQALRLLFLYLLLPNLPILPPNLPNLPNCCNAFYFHALLPHPKGIKPYSRYLEVENCQLTARRGKPT